MKTGEQFRKFAPRGIRSGLDKYFGAVRMNMPITPSIVDEYPQNVSIMDVFSRLMIDRILFLGTEIDDYVANVVVAQLLFMDANKDDDSSPIYMYINSPGGSVYSGLSIFDTMHHITTPVHTTVTGVAASMAFILAISGDKGNRAALKHARLMQHQPSGGMEGDAAALNIYHKQINKVQNEMYEIISDKTGQPFKKVKKDCDRDYWMTAAESLEYGAIDKVL